MPKCPADIDKDAKATWKELAPIVHRMGMLTEVDGPAFANLCQIRGRIIQINKFIKRENPSLVQVKRKIDPETGQDITEFVPSPYEVMARQYYELFRKYASEFGLTPRGRVGLAVVGKDSDDDFGDLLKVAK